MLKEKPSSEGITMDVAIVCQLEEASQVSSKGLTLPCQVQNVPLSRIVLLSTTRSIPDTDSCTLMIPSTSQPTDTFDISLPSIKSERNDEAGAWLTLRLHQDASLKLSLCTSSSATLQPCADQSQSPGRVHSARGKLTRSIWFRAALDAEYAANLARHVQKTFCMRTWDQSVPIFKASKVDRRARVTRHKSHGPDGNAGMKKFLCTNNRADSIGVQMS